MAFSQDLEFSMGSREAIDCDMIRMAIPCCANVYKTSPEIDRAGIDYVAVLDGGAIINIDAKTRRKGVRRPNGFPELAIETWSVMPTNDNKYNGKVGWTYSCSTNVDMILYSFDKTEWNYFYLIPFQHLRMASIKNYYDWYDRFSVRKQYNSTWVSECIFVPANIVLEEVKNVMCIEQVNVG